MRANHADDTWVRTLSSYMRKVHGGRVQRLLVRGGFTCPNRDGTISRGGCAFCDFTSTFTDYTRGLTSITDQLRAAARVVSRRSKARMFMAYFHDATATHGDLERLDKMTEEALRFPGVVALALGTRPDCLGDEALDLLEKLSASTDLWLELGLQSADDSVLKSINRGHDVACFEQAVDRARKRGIKICAHVILGLPGESPGGAIGAARLLASLGVEGVKLHNFHVLEGTAFADEYRRGRIEPPSLKEYCILASRFLEHLPPSVVVHRLSGYARQENLLAPSWTADRWKGREAVLRFLKSSGSWQGKALGGTMQDLK